MKFKMKRTHLLITSKLSAIFLMAWLMISCYPEQPDVVSDFDLVTTNYWPDFWNNNTPTTYYMPDSLGWIIDGENPDNNDTISINENEFVLEQIALNLSSLGYERLDTIDDNNQPDIVVFANALVIINASISYLPTYPWWGGYYPWWPGYGYYYPWGYTPVVSSYTTGTVIISMVDYKNMDVGNKQLEVVWTAGMNGLLRSTESSNKQFITKSINQAFSQSPYLR
jgi:hypothetical protein